MISLIPSVSSTAATFAGGVGWNAEPLPLPLLLPPETGGKAPLPRPWKKDGPEPLPLLPLGPEGNAPLRLPEPTGHGVLLAEPFWLKPDANADPEPLPEPTGHGVPLADGIADPEPLPEPTGHGVPLAEPLRLTPDAIADPEPLPEPNGV